LLGEGDGSSLSLPPSDQETVAVNGATFHLSFFWLYIIIVIVVVVGLVFIISFERTIPFIEEMVEGEKALNNALESGGVRGPAVPELTARSDFFVFFVLLTVIPAVFLQLEFWWNRGLEVEGQR